MSKNNQVSKEWCDECKECRSYSRQSIDHTCPCHTKEVEEKCVCNDLPDIPHKHNDGRVIIPYQHTPKVATSEKENKYRSPRQIGCNHCSTPHESSEKECACKGNECFDFHSTEHCCVINKCYKDYHSVNVTPHESEDWEAEFDAQFSLEREVAASVTQEDIRNEVKSFIRELSSKSYQRGIEERDEFWKNQEMGVATDCWKHAESAKFDVLSFAVQEIEKGKILGVFDDRKWQDHRDMGFNQGLDKAKEIIHSLASLKK